MLSFAERGFCCLGNASTDEEGAWVFGANLTSDPPRYGELEIQVKMITGDQLEIMKETCL